LAKARKSQRQSAADVTRLTTSITFQAGIVKKSWGPAFLQAQSRLTKLKLELAVAQSAYASATGAVKKNGKAFADANRGISSDTKLFRDQLGRVPQAFRPYLTSIDRAKRVTASLGLQVERTSQNTRRSIVQMGSARPNFTPATNAVSTWFQQMSTRQWPNLKMGVDVFFPPMPSGDGAVIDMLIAQGGDPANLAGSMRGPLGLMRDIGSGLSMTSGYRAGAVTSTGNPSDHGTGHAIDVAGDASTMSRYAQRVKQVFGGRGLKQIIYSPLGWASGDGGWSPIPSDAGTVKKDHYNHVHVAMYKRGGTAVPGRGMGDKVPALLEPGEVVWNRNAVAAMGGPAIANRMNSMIPRFATGGIVDSILNEALNRARRPLGWLEGQETNLLNRLNVVTDTREALPAKIKTAERILARDTRSMNKAKAAIPKKAGKLRTSRLQAYENWVTKVQNDKTRVQALKAQYAELANQQVSISDEIVSIRDEIKQLRESGGSTDPGSEGTSLTDLIAQISSLMAVLAAGSSSERGNLFRGITINQNFQQQPNADHWAAATMFQLQRVGG
jgi:hypothetical protein